MAGQQETQPSLGERKIPHYNVLSKCIIFNSQGIEYRKCYSKRFYDGSQKTKDRLLIRRGSDPR